MMNVSVSAKKYFIVSVMIIVLVIFGIAAFNASAKSMQYFPDRTLYENTEKFSIAKEDIVTKTAYGKNIGNIYIKGAVDHESEFKDMKAYAVKNMVTFGYSNNSKSYSTGDPAAWFYVGADEKQVGDIKFSKKIGDGTILIQKSRDGKNWENACEPIRNVFSNEKLDLSNLYTTIDSDVKRGTYYRILTLYLMVKGINPHEGWFGLIDYDDYDERYYSEESVFFITYSDNPIQLYELSDRSKLSDGDSATSGFIIDLRGNNAKVTVEKDSELPEEAKTNDIFILPGSYSINVTSPMGDTFTSTIKVTEGLSEALVAGEKYENPEKSGYKQENEVKSDFITTVTVNQKAGATIKTGSINKYKCYGITNDEAYIYMNLRDLKEYKSTGWEVVSDEWGKKEEQTVDDIKTDSVGAGTLIIQESSDGKPKSWNTVKNNEYPNRIKPIGYGDYYAGLGDILVYHLSGDDLIKGKYIRILYAYKVKQVDGKEKRRCLEKYEFYLCSDKLDVVTFHNLTGKDTIDDVYGDWDEGTLEMYETAETMDSGAVTVSGFAIDRSLNPTVEYTIKKDGSQIFQNEKDEYTENGRYDIHLESAVGSTKDVTLYVDRLTTEGTIKLYFGEGLIDGKRIFDGAAKYPVFEGGKTKYSLSKVSNYYQPLYGSIRNLNTGKSIDIKANHSMREAVLTEAGEYEAVFNINPTYNTKEPSGDNKVITYHFHIIEEGTAPGPQCNYKALLEWERKNISGIHHKYFGVTRRSRGNGNITYVYATREAAIEASRRNEAGRVMKQEDGTVTYSDSSEELRRAKYDDNFALSDDYQDNADDKVQELYIDASDENTYRIAKGSSLETYKYCKDVITYEAGTNQREKLEITDALPILNAKMYAFQPTGENAETETKNKEFKFTKDKYGCDSNSVKIMDAEGKEIQIIYGEDVSPQLENHKCATGKVTIFEETIYGDSNSYEAVYFANGDNTAEIEISYFEGEEEKTLILDQNDNGALIEADAFSIKKITDQLDPYNMVIIWNKAKQGTIPGAYEAGQEMNGSWSEDGEYELSVVNRIGNKFTFTVNIEDSIYATIAFKGQGTDGFKDIIVKRGDRDVELPIPEREGYIFAGYSDEEGTIFDNVVGQITFNGKKTLSPIWRVSKKKVICCKPDGEVINSIEADYGTTIDIPDPEIPDGYKFEGWVKDGVLIKDNKFTISDEAEVVLTAQFSIKKSKKNSQEEPSEFNKGNDQGANSEDVIQDVDGKDSDIPVFIIVALMAVLGCGAVAYKKRHS
ncbi:InlB B-repeat-containing protein [Butyrivibrio sp. VCD2006]|uniref:InlB B-repeat-containing protein n=1 Tax=Butyrivibrio sp. VCD2006 TaxID=1280664 RepID=UPI00041229A6|nr:InlB B-repeat-containing protein [Butyrivibrio sp. VCD2006]